MSASEVFYETCPFDMRLARTPYLVIPKMALQAMPMAWRKRLIALLEEADNDGLETPDYHVLRKGSEYSREIPENEDDPYGPLDRIDAFRPDPWAEYRHATIADVQALSPGFQPPSVMEARQ